MKKQGRRIVERVSKETVGKGVSDKYIKPALKNVGSDSPANIKLDSFVAGDVDIPSAA